MKYFEKSRRVMKTGILTLPPLENYGGILQVYAMQTALQRLGHDTFLIDYNRYSLPLWKAPLSYTKRTVNKYILRKKNAPDVFYEQGLKIVCQNTKKFVDKYIFPKISFKHIPELYSENKLDAIVVGSDQVWRPRYFPGKIQDAYLAFTKGWDIKRIAYAASFGVSHWEYNDFQTQTCRFLAQKFDAISVRENGGIDLCKRYLNVEAQHVLDPTMLLTFEDYQFLIDSSDQKHSVNGNLLVYFLDDSEEKEQSVTDISKQKGYTPFKVNQLSNQIPAHFRQKKLPHVEQWLAGFQQADFIITDSFHGTVFAILFNKPFLVFGNKDRGIDRLYSLLGLFQLENRLVFALDEAKQRLSSSINWDVVNDKIYQLREQSINFLKNSLKNE